MPSHSPLRSSRSQCLQLADIVSDALGRTGYALAIAALFDEWVAYSIEAIQQRIGHADDPVQYETRCVLRLGSEGAPVLGRDRLDTGGCADPQCRRTLDQGLG